MLQPEAGKRADELDMREWLAQGTVYNVNLPSAGSPVVVEEGSRANGKLRGIGIGGQSCQRRQSVEMNRMDEVAIHYNLFGCGGRLAADVGHACLGRRERVFRNQP